MKPEELLELVRGGFTHDEIMQLVAPVSVPDPAPAPEPAPEPAHEPDPAPAPAPAPDPDPVPDPEPDQPSLADLIKANQDLQKQVAKLTSTVQAAEIARSVLPGGGFQKPTAEDAIAQIIRPTYEKKT